MCGRLTLSLHLAFMFCWSLQFCCCLNDLQTYLSTCHRNVKFPFKLTSNWQLLTSFLFPLTFKYILKISHFAFSPFGKSQEFRHRFPGNFQIQFLSFWLAADQSVPIVCFCPLHLCSSANTLSHILSLHKHLWLSPNRNRILQFPAIVNCTTIDWFSEWPKDALLEVAERYLDGLDLGSAEGVNDRRIQIHTLLFSHFDICFWAVFICAVECRRSTGRSPVYLWPLTSPWKTSPRWWRWIWRDIIM